MSRIHRQRRVKARFSSLRLQVVVFAILGLALVANDVVGQVVQAPQSSQAVRLRTEALLTASPDAPDGKGLLSAALADARAALVKAREAGAAPKDLGAMQTQARGVLHAMDPTLVRDGPGTGLGVRQAMTLIREQVRMLASEDGRSDAAKATGTASTACANVQTWADALVDVAQRVVDARSAEQAAALVPQLLPLARQLTAGLDRNNDGRVSLAAGEAGLLGVQQALGGLVVGREGRLPQALKESGR